MGKGPAWLTVSERIKSLDIAWAFQAKGFKGISASNIWLKFKEVLSGPPLEGSGRYCVKLLSAGGYVEFHGS